MTVILLRHGRSVSNTAHTLAGRTEGVELDEKGSRQAAELVGRVEGLPIRALIRSPLLRCRLTLEPLAAALGLQPLVDERLAEVEDLRAMLTSHGGPTRGDVATQLREAAARM